MASLTEAAKVDHVLRFEVLQEFCREEHTVLDGETIAIGDVCKLDANDKVVECGAAVNEVHTITFDAAMTAGILDVTIFAPDNTPIPVAVPWDTNWATTMAAWNTAVTAAATVWAGTASVGAVMTGTATVPVLTYSGVGFAGLPVPHVAVADVSGTTGPTNASTAVTTEGHSAGGDATMIALQAASPSGADGLAIMLRRGPAIVDKDQCTWPTGGEANGIVALELLGILALAEPTKQSVMPG